jgi:hypothetical protein
MPLINSHLYTYQVSEHSVTVKPNALLKSVGPAVVLEVEGSSTLVEKLDDFDTVSQYGLPDGSFEMAV